MIYCCANRLLTGLCLQETIDFINYSYPAWRIEGHRINIQNDLKGAKSEEIPSMKLISNTLSYATELERIV